MAEQGCEEARRPETTPGNDAACSNVVSVQHTKAVKVELDDQMVGGCIQLGLTHCVESIPLTAFNVDFEERQPPSSRTRWRRGQLAQVFEGIHAAERGL